ncbi:Vacuolar protein sorting-associated protein 54, chloroplastic [Vitis vinifera]|uniref:Vacuolar protein sorting-associated protein 54, chloroplastic n=1 Tax=Vitis vinifera TaxID=29760 RepID=A0A438J715_VITVI|nr:Vacuolar protein sorting-associated protein 54, chloroplastic [Vitis vinifera]
MLIASADCAGALDVTDDLQHLLDGDELTGLHCFRHLRDRVATSIDSINRFVYSTEVGKRIFGSVGKSTREAIYLVDGMERFIKKRGLHVVLSALEKPCDGAPREMMLKIL